MRFVYGVTDDTIAGKRFGMGSRKWVWGLRQQATTGFPGISTQVNDLYASRLLSSNRRRWLFTQREKSGMELAASNKSASVSRLKPIILFTLRVLYRASAFF